MPNKLVVCSDPEDDNYVGEEYNADFCNIIEYDWEELKQKIQKYPEVNTNIAEVYFKTQ